jgi:hypothetical protein
MGIKFTQNYDKNLYHNAKEVTYSIAMHHTIKQPKNGLSMRLAVTYELQTRTGTLK